MKKLAAATLIALSLVGCGVLPTTENSATTATTTKSSLLSIMGLDEEAVDAGTATESVRPEGPRMGPGQLLFALLDADGDEKITLEEMSSVLKAKTSIDDEQLADVFAKMDRNGDGAVALSELQPERRVEHRKPPRHGGPRRGGCERPPFPGDDEGGEEMPE